MIPDYQQGATVPMAPNLWERSLSKSKSSDDVLTDLVEEHGDYLYRFALRSFSAPDVAQDLVQETFLAACEKIDSFRGSSSPRTWLISILRHKIIDRIRHKTRKSAPIMQHLESTDKELDKMFDGIDHWIAARGPVAWTDSPESVVEQKQFMKSLYGCLEKIPHRVREVFVLREVNEFSIEEVAQELGISLGNVRVILHRARLLLRDCVDFNWLRAGEGQKT